MSLTVILNGQQRQFTNLPDNSSLANLIEELGLTIDRVAVEHNGEIAARAEWAERLLSSGDRLEIVHFVGGGHV